MSPKAVEGKGTSMEYSAREYEVLFDKDTATGDLRQGVSLYRTSTVTAGQTREIDIYPIWDNQKTASAAKRERMKHREAQRRVDRRNAQRRLRRMINANFGAGDILITNTYAPGQEPQDEREAQRNMQNYIRRIKTLRARKGLPAVKYVYVTEVTHSEARGTRYHHHMIISGGIDRETLESMWRGGHSNSRTARPDRDWLGGFAHYMTKTKETQEKATHRGWNCSKNLTRPQATHADHKVSIRKAQRIARQMEDESRRILEIQNPGYVLTEIIVRHSQYAPGVYIYARMINKNALRQ